MKPYRIPELSATFNIDAAVIMSRDKAKQNLAILLNNGYHVTNTAAHRGYVSKKIVIFVPYEGRYGLGIAIFQHRDTGNFTIDYMTI